MYCWFAISGGLWKEDDGGFLKLGPVTFCIYRWFDGGLRFEMHTLNHLLFCVPALR